MLSPLARSAVETWNRTAPGPRHGHRHADLVTVAPGLEEEAGRALAVRVLSVGVGLRQKARRERWTHRPPEVSVALETVEQTAAALSALPPAGDGPRQAIGPLVRVACPNGPEGQMPCPPTVPCPRVITETREVLENCPVCQGAPSRKRPCFRCVAGLVNCPACAGRGRIEDRICADCTGGKVYCPNCDGVGVLESACETCAGKGTVPVTLREEKPCPICSGSGARECPHCSGSGSVLCDRCGGDGAFADWSDGTITFTISLAAQELVPLSGLAPLGIPAGSVFEGKERREPPRLLHTRDEFDPFIASFPGSSDAADAVGRLAALRGQIGPLAGPDPNIVLYAVEQVPLDIIRVSGLLPDGSNLDLTAYGVSGSPSGRLAILRAQGAPPVSSAARSLQDHRDRRAALVAIGGLLIFGVLLVLGALSVPALLPILGLITAGAILTEIGLAARPASRHLALEPFFSVSSGLTLLRGRPRVPPVVPVAPGPPVSAFSPPVMPSPAAIRRRTRRRQAGPAVPAPAVQRAEAPIEGYDLPPDDGEEAPIE